ncbi:phenylalanine--tRNA ligase subunit alpha [Patescibacteria group bacterium]|nr:phenylalanine--tRNA ligase subunit alpha [Patescibacteria group bacterium]
MKEEFEQLKDQAQEALKSVLDRDKLEVLKIEFLGRKGKMAELMKQIVNVADEERKLIGALANEVKTGLESAFSAKEQELAGAEEAGRAEKEWLDISEPGAWSKEGHLHPVTTAIGEISDIFARLGFACVRAPEVEWDYYAFESLNMPPDHPARDDWETFFIADGAQTAQGKGEKQGKMVLTPHTSNSQNREMAKGKLPIRMININRTYRRQSDVSHTPMFHQFEGLMIDQGVTIAHLKGVLDYFARTYFGAERKTRLRPHHFRFTEPSFEIDISCGVCQGHASSDSTCRLCKAGWLELGGAGMVHPNVIRAGGLDPEKYTGFAFGWGIERTLMMREGMQVDDIRTLYRNDLRFVKQF